MKHREELEKKYNLKEIAIFGSFARGEQHKRSDIDIIVEFNKTPDIFLLIDLEDHLQKLLRRKVDIVRKSAVRPEIKKQILRERILI